MKSPDARLAEAIIEVIPGSKVDFNFRPPGFDGTIITVTKEAANWQSDYRLSRRVASQFDEYSEDLLLAQITAHFLREYNQRNA